MSYTLLLADDSVTIQRVIELTFADEDVRVVAVSDGSEAIALLDQSPPDIVLADVGMPGQNGYEVARHVKGTPRLAHIPVLLLTGAFEPIDQAKVNEVGCDGVLAKPFEPQLVIARVKELLARPRGVPAEPWAAPADEQPLQSEGGSPSPPPGDMDNYFDRLDAALSNLAGASQPRPQRSEPMPDVRRDPASHEWFDTAVIPDTPAPETIASQRAPAAARASAAAVQAPPAPSLADAFSALLAAEQSAENLSLAPSWTTPRPALAPEDTAEIVREVTRRVLDQLTDRVVRETVSEIVSKSAERLVRAEIDRIKRHIE